MLATRLSFGRMSRSSNGRRGTRNARIVKVPSDEKRLESRRARTHERQAMERGEPEAAPEKQRERWDDWSWT
jgi:hypothetical protein